MSKNMAFVISTLLRSINLIISAIFYSLKIFVEATYTFLIDVKLLNISFYTKHYVDRELKTIPPRARKSDEEHNWVCAIEFVPFRKHASSMATRHQDASSTAAQETE